MRGFPDRFWWVLAAGGSLVVLESLLLLGYVALAYVLPTPFFSRGHEIILAGTIVLTAVSLAFPIMGFRARSRFRRRMRALHGDQEAMPRANISVDPDAAPDVTSEPLELRWRFRAGSGVSNFMMSGVVVFFALALPFWCLGLLRYTLPDWSDLSTLPAIYHADWFQVAASVIFWLSIIAMPLLICYLLFLLYLIFFGRSCKLVARDNGLWYTPRLRTSRLLRWEELRLVEVEGTAIHRLYGTQVVILWNDPPSLPLLYMSLNEQFAERQQALLNLIVRKTSLVPRTLQPGLVMNGAADERGHQTAVPLAGR